MGIFKRKSKKSIFQKKEIKVFKRNKSGTLFLDNVGCFSEKGENTLTFKVEQGMSIIGALKKADINKHNVYGLEYMLKDE